MVIGAPTPGYSPRSKKGDPYAGAVATWEHVLPRKLRTAGVASLKLLACYDCNATKGDDPPSDEHVRLALEQGREWFSIDCTGTEAARAKQVAAITRDAERFLRHGEEGAARARELQDDIARVSPAPSKAKRQAARAEEEKARKAERREERQRLEAHYKPLSRRTAEARAKANAATQAAARAYIGRPLPRVGTGPKVRPH